MARIGLLEAERLATVAAPACEEEAALCFGKLRGGGRALLLGSCDEEVASRYCWEAGGRAPRQRVASRCDTETVATRMLLKHN